MEENSVFVKVPEVHEAIIYGSCAKGICRIGSDIDLTLKGKNLTSDILSKIINKIDELNTPYLFDISIFERLHAPDLDDHINRAGQIFYSKNILQKD